MEKTIDSFEVDKAMQYFLDKDSCFGQHALSLLKRKADCYFTYSGIQEYLLKMNNVGQYLGTPSHKPDREQFSTPGVHYTVSARYIESDLSVSEYLKLLYPFIDLSQVSSFYGFTNDFVPLYGGRTFSADHALKPHHLAEMKELGISLSLNLTNHFFDEELYQNTLALLEKHHEKGNAITCFNDELAVRIRKDFPLYQLKASIIKNLRSVSRVSSALALYDKVVIPMDLNDDVPFLSSLLEKERIIIFANASCAYNCPSRSCYVGFSQKNAQKEITASCSIPKHERENLGKVFFDVKSLRQLGFKELKLVPPFFSPLWNQRKSLYQKIKVKAL